MSLRGECKSKRKKDRRCFWSRYFDAPSGGWPLTVRSVGYNRCKAGEGLMMTRHPWHHWLDEKDGRTLPTLTMVHVIRGEGFFRSAATNEIDVPTGSLIFAFPGVRHYYCYRDETGWDDEWLEVEAAAILPVLKKAGIDPAHPVVRLGSQARLAAAFRKMLDLARHGASEGRLAACALETLVAAVEGASDGSCAKSPVDRMAERLNLSQFDDMSVSQAAKASGLSASRMRTLFRERMGLSPKRYQLKLRLERAVQLLSFTPTPVADVARQVGFRTTAAFSSAFARTYGLPPTRYRDAGCRPS